MWSFSYLGNRGKMNDPSSVAGAAGAGDFMVVKQLLDAGANPNLRSQDGMTPLSVAAFWGYDKIVQLLIQHGADVNSSNLGTLWTPLHCAAFQGHGKTIMILMESRPDLHKPDCQGRTAVDFASALDSIWAFFAAAGCQRTSRSDLIKMDIVRKVFAGDPAVTKTELLDFSRSDSADLATEIRNKRQQMIPVAGDVLAISDDNSEQANWIRRMKNPPLTVWNI